MWRGSRIASRSPAELLALECDFLVPAALENTIDAENAPPCARKIVAEAANGPLTPAADRILESNGVFVIPDILCNAGGVTVSYFEWVQDEQHLFWEAQDVYNRLERVMKIAFRDVLKIHVEKKVPMRTAANMLGVGRVAGGRCGSAASTHRWKNPVCSIVMAGVACLRLRPSFLVERHVSYS